jgi:uncharacterized membrane protein YccF (DUF307 family)
VDADARSARLDATKHWAGYGWFMSFGTLFPLIIFLASYAVHLTLVGAPVARTLYGFGIWTSTFGQEPPGKDKLESRTSRKKSLVERITPYSPPGYVARRGTPVPLVVRAVWFLLVGWWLGALWVLLSWSVFLAPYPFLDTVAALLAELPSVMTLAQPARTRPAPSLP